MYNIQFYYVNKFEFSAIFKIFKGNFTIFNQTLMQFYKISIKFVLVLYLVICINALKVIYRSLFYNNNLIWE